MVKKSPKKIKYDAEWKHNNRAKIRLYLQEHKATRKCSKCGESRSYCLVFHHRNPNRKKFDLSLSRDKAFTSIIAEIRKCDVLCANCHLELHAIQRIDETERLTSGEIYKQDWLFD